MQTSAAPQRSQWPKMLPGGGHCTNTRFTGLFNQSNLPCRTWPEPAQGLQTAFPATLLKPLPFRQTKVFASWPFMSIRSGCRFAVVRARCPFNVLECWFFTRSRIAPRRSRLTFRGVDFLKSAESIFDLLFHTESILYPVMNLYL